MKTRKKGEGARKNELSPGEQIASFTRSKYEQPSEDAKPSTFSDYCSLVAIELLLILGLARHRDQPQRWFTEWNFSTSLKIHFGLLSLSLLGTAMVLPQWNDVLVFLTLPSTIDIVIWISWDFPDSLSIFNLKEMEEYCKQCKKANMSLHETKELYRYGILNKERNGEKNEANELKKRLIELNEDLRSSMPVYRLRIPMALSTIVNVLALVWVLILADLGEISLITTDTQPNTVKKFVWLGLALLPILVRVGRTIGILVQSTEKYIAKQWKRDIKSSRMPPPKTSPRSVIILVKFTLTVYTVVLLISVPLFLVACVAIRYGVPRILHKG